MNSENLLLLFEKSVYIPKKVFTQSIMDMKHQHLYHQIYKLGRDGERDFMINGEIMPIFVVLEGEFTQKILDELTTGLKVKIALKQQGQIIPTFNRFLDSCVNICSTSKYNDYSYQHLGNTLIICQLFTVNLHQDLNGLRVELFLTIEYQDRLATKWISTAENINQTLLSQNLTIAKQPKYSSDMAIELDVINPLEFSSQLNSGFTENALITFNLNCKDLFSINNNQDLHESCVNLGINDFGIEILNIELVLPKSSLQWVDNKTNLVKQAPHSILKHIQVKKAIMQQLPTTFTEELEGFFQLEVDWQTILQKETEVQIPVKGRQRRVSVSTCMVNPHLVICTPMLIRWRFKGHNHFTNSVFKVDWGVQPVSELGVKVKEVVRYKHESQEYLALKLVILNYTTQRLDLSMLIQPEIFGQRFKKKKNLQNTVEVMAVCLNTKQEIGEIDPCSNVEKLLRLRLINVGILHLEKVGFHDKVTNRTIDVNINFLHSYEE